MAGGAKSPYSAIPDPSDEVFPYVVSESSKYEEGMGLANATDLSADRTWHLRFQVPPVLPTGSPKLLVKAIAAATAGVVKYNPKWVAVAAESNPFTATRVAETTQTMTWSTGDSNVYKQAKVALDVTTAPAADDVVVVDFVFENANTDLAQISIWQVFLIWE